MYLTSVSCSGTCQSSLIGYLIKCACMHPCGCAVTIWGLIFPSRMTAIPLLHLGTEPEATLGSCLLKIGPSMNKSLYRSLLSYSQRETSGSKTNCKKGYSSCQCGNCRAQVQYLLHRQMWSGAGCVHTVFTRPHLHVQYLISVGSIIPSLIPAVPFLDFVKRQGLAFASQSSVSMSFTAAQNPRSHGSL